ncbi:hypothetical protein BKP42_52670 [Rhodococcus erythropolis]|uniref:hypothetical protein n=1 Tax=Rhodococcus erythropolis TaxID=1833 RepID=UPI00209C214E|nr:hypothetical protein [Rhodococcus erythropolis]PBI91848.1 hypothetical protein BKP42_52670 [Rhodococcus erythropolis]
MCRPKPGPRCTPHIRKRLDKAAARLDSARAGLDQNPTHAGLQRRVAAAEAAYRDNLKVYDSTPGGQNELRTAIEPEPEPGRRAELMRRLAVGQQLRTAQTEAMRRIRSGVDNDNTRGEHDGRTDDAGTPREILEEVRLELGTAGGPAQGDRSTLSGLGDRGSRNLRLLIGGQQVQPVADHVLSADERESFAARGLSAPTLYELAPTDADVYREQMLELTRKNPYAASVHVYDEDEYRQMRLLVTDDGKAGVAIKDDEVVSVFAHKDSAHADVAQSMLRQTTMLGGRRLDCFDTVLPNLYADAGFVPVARLAWNDDYAPKGWDYQQFSRFNGGRPDVVFMAYNADHVGDIYTPGTGEYVDDYDEGIACAQAYRHVENRRAQAVNNMLEV